MAGLNGIVVVVDDGSGNRVFEEQVDDPVQGDLAYFDGSYWQRLAPGTTGQFLRTQGAAANPIWGDALTDSTHAAVRQLIHFLEEGPGSGFSSGAYKETLPAANPFPTSVIWWTTSGKTAKIVELTITRNANQTPATEVWKVYDTDGSTVLVTLTDTIAYSGVFETSRTRTWV